MNHPNQPDLETFEPLSLAPAVPALSRIQTQQDQQHTRQTLLQGLLAPQARICPKFLYDEQGCALYNAICNLAEYYPTRTEAGIFNRYRNEIARKLPRGCQWVDLGCGDGAKAFEWLMHVNATRYVGVDIASDWLQNTLQSGAKRFPEIEFIGIVTDFTKPLKLDRVIASAEEMTPVLFYPGSSIGNFEPEAALSLLQAMRMHLGRDGKLLIGVDTPKDTKLLEAAYDDALGVTAAFNRNVLRAVNRELGSDFDPRGFAHRAVFNATHSRVEMHLVSLREQLVHLESQARHFAVGEYIVTEHSYKYSTERFTELLSLAGFGRIDHFSDETGGFNVFLASPAGALE
ncbi:L-histidine N(alpha)-methyltransferase [Chitiniphilus purpureus]|uniref:L-histidine N(Alpha)-methyltransferase n=1 Tax=Chitiniphilus purpureus TaxID=2981137 RepID=A0ABY6DN15_9NEIS|nr:L-histidine N(alpha)-methyltransferase [Chitiniphilus sp. CD1]UXY15749.1 L-histidine N(alpha)-methyltransferase [Chitiniphilus sp. CD1]